MKINENTSIRGEKVILVPYEKRHVNKYHLWMQSEELQELTASEPLTLIEEYDMQRSWREDENKCTFIILDLDTFNKTNDDVVSMIGDTNLFLDKDDSKMAEAEIMIAEKYARGKGYGKEALTLLLLYSIRYLKIHTLTAKISLSNETSIKLFEKLGFRQSEVSDVFMEVTMKKHVDDEWIKTLSIYDFETIVSE